MIYPRGNHCRIIPELCAIAPPSAPPLESVSVTAGTDKPDEIAFFNAYTKETLWRGDGDDGDGSFIRANRTKLREWLWTRLDVKLNKIFVRYDVDVRGVTAFFADGSTARGDIIVGADGLRSKGMLVCRVP
jgi:2-polyprenyl-6-methoxyphenol hydroxylase-like FAD-dependent oxidoreductase